MCWTTGGRGTFPLIVDKKPIAVPLLTFKGQTQIDCETDDDLNVRIFDPAPSRVLDIPLVRPSVDDVDLGVELRAHPNGTSVVDVADEAKAAGLQPGDIITDIDGISVINLSPKVVRALGFRLPPGVSAKLAVLRAQQQISIVVRSPMVVNNK
jgi:S1-C subfamily serine protease